MTTKRKEVLVRMPDELKRRLTAEVARRRSNLNDVAVEILASRFGVPFVPSGRSGAPPGESRDVVLRRFGRCSVCIFHHTRIGMITYV